MNAIDHRIQMALAYCDIARLKEPEMPGLSKTLILSAMQLLLDANKYFIEAKEAREVENAKS